MKAILRVYMSVLLAVIPVIFLPVVVDSFGFGKNWLVVVLMVLGLLVWVSGLVMEKEKATIKWNSVFGWWFLLFLWSTISFWTGGVGIRVKGIMGYWGWGAILALTGLAFLWMQQTKKDGEDSQLKYLTIAGVLVALVSLAVFLIPAKKFPISIPTKNPMLTINTDWSLAGSMIGEVWMLTVLVWLWIERLWRRLKSKGGYVVEALVSGFLVLVLLLDFYRILKGGWIGLDLRSSWMIAVESLKQFPLMGAGLGNFMEAFYWWRPGSFNAGSGWVSVHQMSGSFALQLWTEMGLVGLISVLMLWWKGWRMQEKSVDRVRMLILGLALLLLPFNFVGLMLWLWLMFAGSSLSNKERKVFLKVGEGNFNVAPVAVAVLLVLGGAFGAYWWSKVLLGEVNYRNSLLAASKNDGGATYNLQIKAIGYNPNYPEYRRMYSQTNMALAMNLIANKDISEDDRQRAVVLVQQAVREAKAAVALDNRNPIYWSNLAVIYKQIVGQVDGAPDWALQAYSQAMVFDPISPTLRLDFGGLMYAMGRYEEADRLFEQAVTLKQDFANAWYNWAYSAKQLGKLQEAVARLSQAVALVSPGSGDYDKASEELMKWKTELEKAQKEVAAKQAETLKLPEAIPTGKKEVVVPKEGLEPPSSEVTPTQSPATPTPVATGTKTQ